MINGYEWCFFKVLNLRTLETSRVTTHHEMHERSYDFLFIIFSAKLWKKYLLRTSAPNICNFLSRSSCTYSSSLGLHFLSFAHFPRTFNHFCVYLVVFLFFAFSFSWSTTSFAPMKEIFSWDPTYCLIVLSINELRPKSQRLLHWVILIRLD